MMNGPEIDPGDFLRKHHIRYDLKNHGRHFVLDTKIGIVDYWPARGKWICRDINKGGEGLTYLLKFIEYAINNAKSGPDINIPDSESYLSLIQIDTNNLITTKALEVWGEDTQIDILLEECAEVIQAIAHYKRGRCGPIKIGDEIADVLVSIQSVAKCFGLVDVIKQQMASKILRLATRIEEFEKNGSNNSR